MSVSTVPGAKPDDVRSVKELNQAVRQARLVVDEGQGGPKATDPVSSALQACRKVGWELRDGVTVVTETGAELLLSAGPPALLRTLFRRRCQQSFLTSYIRDKFEDHGPLADVVTGKAEAYVHPIHRVLRSKGRKAVSFRQKCAVLQFISNSFPTADRLQAWGFAVPIDCPFVG